MKKIVVIIFISSLGLIFSFKKEDVSGNDIAEIKIGTQTWTASNLELSIFRNGDPIPEVKSAQEWKKSADDRTPAWCYYDIDTENGKKYGKLYNWYAANDPRKIAPKGWHIPSNSDWELLEAFLGGKKTSLAKLKSKNGWKDLSGKDANGTNESGFNALATGYRIYYGDFIEIGQSTGWWCTNSYDINKASLHSIIAGYNKMSGDYAEKHSMYSVRCIKD